MPDRGDAAPYASDRNYWIIKQHGFQGAYWFHHLGADPNARDRYVDLWVPETRPMAADLLLHRWRQPGMIPPWRCS